MTSMREPSYTATYGNEDLDVYAAPDGGARPLVVYVHGGAWRSENKEQHAALAVRIRELTGCGVAVLDYRLTTEENGLKHPGHARDVLDALRFLTAWPDGAPFDATRLYLVGHSAGAHMLTSLLLDAAASLTPLPADTDYLRPDGAVLRAVRGVALASGIYDVARLVAAFPAYERQFVRQAFRAPYACWDTTRYPLHAGAAALRWRVIHSAGDTAVDLGQSQAMFAHLRRLYAERGWDAERVSKDWDTLTGPHDYTHLPEFAQMIADWVTQDMQDY